MVGVRTLNIFQPSAYVKVLEPSQSYLNMLVPSVGRTGEVSDGLGVLGRLCLEMSGGPRVHSTCDALRPRPPAKTGSGLSLLWELGRQGQMGPRVPGKLHG